MSTRSRPLFDRDRRATKTELQQIVDRLMPKFGKVTDQNYLMIEGLMSMMYGPHRLGHEVNRLRGWSYDGEELECLKPESSGSTEP